MKIKKQILFIGLLLVPFFAFSVVSDGTVDGRVVRYNKKTVTLEQKSGVRITLPRSSIPKRFHLKTGKQISAVIKGKVIREKLKTSLKRKKQALKKLKK